jgi:hypothetical protein
MKRKEIGKNRLFGAAFGSIGKPSLIGKGCQKGIL